MSVGSDSTVAVRVDRVVKRFGATTALAGVDLEVTEGTVFALLGPNGAGKTTLVRVLATLLEPDAGRAEVFGCDVVRDADAVREMLGLTGQFAAVDEILSGRENLLMFGRLFGLSKAETGKRADELLAQFELTDAADRSARTYSGGTRRRLDLASSLLTRPRILFLDEPTTGLDPRSRNEIWTTVRELVREGTTLLLTTQYLEEADQLADRIAVIDHGRVIAQGTGNELKDQVGGQILEVELTVGGADRARRRGRPGGGLRGDLPAGVCELRLRARRNHARLASELFEREPGHTHGECRSLVCPHPGHPEFAGGNSGVDRRGIGRVHPAMRVAIPADELAPLPGKPHRARHENRLHARRVSPHAVRRHAQYVRAP